MPAAAFSPPALLKPKAVLLRARLRHFIVVPPLQYRPIGPLLWWAASLIDRNVLEAGVNGQACELPKSAYLLPCQNRLAFEQSNGTESYCRYAQS